MDEGSCEVETDRSKGCGWLGWVRLTQEPDRDEMCRNILGQVEGDEIVQMVWELGRSRRAPHVGGHSLHSFCRRLAVGHLAW